MISNLTVPASIYTPPNDQADTFGLSTAALAHSVIGTVDTWTNGQVMFTLGATTPWLLRIDFAPDSGDTGFAPGDRLRFGARVNALGNGGTNNDGDAVGAERVKVTVTFAILGVALPPVDGEFYNSNFRRCGVPRPDPPPPDIDPCIPGNAPFVIPEATPVGMYNDNQSYVMIGAMSNHAMGVRAQATANVNSVCGHLFGVTLPVFKVSACATARYDCSIQRPQLIRVTPENFICTP